MTDDDPPEPGSSSRDRLLDQADAAHEHAVRKLQDDVRLADRFQDLAEDATSEDPLFYRLRKKPSVRLAEGSSSDKKTQPGVGPVVPLRPTPAADAPKDEPTAEPPAADEPDSPAPAKVAPLPPVSVEPRGEVERGSKKNLVLIAIIAAVGAVVLSIALASGPDDTASSESPKSAAPVQTQATAPVVPTTAAPAGASSVDPSSAATASTSAPTSRPPAHPSARPEKTSKPNKGEFTQEGWDLKR